MSGDGKRAAGLLSGGLDSRLALALVRELLEHEGHLEVRDVSILKLGRQFRLSPRTKAVVGRDEAENAKIEVLAAPTDFLVGLEDIPGPTVLVRGPAVECNIATAASLAARYSKARRLTSVRATRRCRGTLDATVIEADPATEALAATARIGSATGGRRVRRAASTRPADTDRRTT